jgi:hypothetical protein
MGLFSRKPKYALQGEAKQAIPKDIYNFQIAELRDKLNALEQYLGIYPIHQVSKFIYQKRGEVSGLSSALQGIKQHDNA